MTPKSSRLYVTPYVALIKGTDWQPILLGRRPASGTHLRPHIPDWFRRVEPADRPRLLDLRFATTDSGGAYSWRYRLASDHGNEVQDRGLVVRRHGVPYAVGILAGPQALRLGATPRPSTALVDGMNAPREVSLSLFAHDLRSMLTVASGAVSSLLRPDVTLLPHHPEMLLSGLSRNLHRIERLVDEIFEVDHLEWTIGRPQQVELSSLAEEAVDSVSVPERVATSLTPVTAAADRTLLRRALINLIENALRHSGDQVRVVVRPTRRGALLGVEDHGSGVQEGLREQIFEPFVRVVPDQITGLGLGLAIVRRIVQMHAGQAWVEDADDHGARFVLWLPSSSSAPDGLAVSAADAPRRRPVSSRRMRPSAAAIEAM